MLKLMFIKYNSKLIQLHHNLIQLHNSVGLNDIIVASGDECSSFANRNCLSTVTNRRTTIATGTDCASVR